MYSIKFEYTLKIRTCIEILAYNGSFKRGASLGNFSLTGSKILGSYAEQNKDRLPLQIYKAISGTTHVPLKQFNGEL